MSDHVNQKENNMNIQCNYTTNELPRWKSFLGDVEEDQIIQPNSILALTSVWGWTADDDIGDMFDVYVKTGDEELSCSEAQRYLKSAYDKRLQELYPGATPRDYFFEGFHGGQVHGSRIYSMMSGT